MRVAVTQAAGVAGALARRLAEAGFEVSECPLIAIEPIPGGPIRADDYDWLVLTSRRAVELLLARVTGPLPKVAVVGPGTAKALRSHGIEPALVARRSSQEGILELMPRPAGRVLFAGAEGARDLLARELAADVLPLYRTVELRPARFPECDLVVLASASAARSFARLGLELPCVSIGPITSAEARLHGIGVVAEATRQDAEGVLEAVRIAASHVQSSRS